MCLPLRAARSVKMQCQGGHTNSRCSALCSSPAKAMLGAPLQEVLAVVPWHSCTLLLAAALQEDWAFQPQRNSVHSFRQWTSCWQEVARLLILGSVTDPLCDLRQITSLLCASSTCRLSSVLSVQLQALGGGWVCSTNHRRALISVGTLSTVQNLQLFCSPYCLH